MNPIDLIGATVSADELDQMDFETRDAVEAAQGVLDGLQVLDDDRPARPGVIRH